MKSRIVGLVFMLYALTAAAATDVWEFNDPAQAARFERLIEELRCPKCQNQNLADSHAPIAEDLRKAVYRMINEGKSDAEIKQWLVDRYGDYVLYRPVWSTRTLLLWLGPALALVIALTGIMLYLRRSSPSSRQAESSLTEDEQQEIEALIKSPSSQEDKS